MRQHLRTHLAASVRSMFTLPNTTRYQVMRQAAIDAARRHGAALWFVEQDRSNVFVNVDGSGGRSGPGGMVGLLLPPGASRGPELFAGGDGSALGTWDLSGPTVVSLVDGEFRIVTGSNFGGASRIIPTTIGRWYEVTATYRSATGNPANIFLRPGGKDTTTDQVQFPSTVGTAPLTHTGYIRATTTSMAVRLTSLLNGFPDTAFFDNISVREIQGFVLANATNSLKPTLAVAGSSYPNRIGLRFDGVDDRLVSVTSPLSSTPGAGYTLIMAGQLGNLMGPRMGVSDGRALGMNGNGTNAFGEVLHGGAARYPFTPVGWPLNARRVVTGRWSGPGGTLLLRQSGSLVSAETGTVAAATTLNPDGMYVGSRNSTQEFWQGDIFLACASSAIMPLEDIQAIERFAGLIGGATVA